MAVVARPRRQRTTDRQAVSIALLLLLAPLSILSILRCHPRMEVGRLSVEAGLHDGSRADGCKEWFGSFAYQDHRQGGWVVLLGDWSAEFRWLPRSYD
jgi:hypothetical protein